MPKVFKLLLLMSLWLVFSTTTFAAGKIVNNLNFSAYKGKWIVITYWATWCGYCMGEVPQLNTFYRLHRDEVAMFGVNYQDPGNLQEHVLQSGVEFPTLARDPKWRFGVHISGLPTTLLIAPNGRLAYVLGGSQTVRGLENKMRLG